MSATVFYLYTPMTAKPETLPNRIREHRQTAKLTLQQLAERIGITKPALAHMEVGRRPLMVDRLRAIARELSKELGRELSVGDLLARSDNPLAPGSQDEARHLENYRGLDAHGRRTVANVAEDLHEWRSRPADEEEAPPSRKAG